MKYCNAGMNPTTMRGSKTGVYIGVSGSEAGEAFSRDPEELLGYSMTGCQRAMLANRLSYFFDFSGMHTHHIFILLAFSLMLIWYYPRTETYRHILADLAVITTWYFKTYPTSSSQTLNWHDINSIASYYCHSLLLTLENSNFHIYLFFFSFFIFTMSVFLLYGVKWA